LKAEALSILGDNDMQGRRIECARGHVIGVAGVYPGEASSEVLVGRIMESFGHSCLYCGHPLRAISTSKSVMDAWNSREDGRWMSSGLQA
jgi:hypothetical protein